MQRTTKEVKRVIFGALAFIILMAVGVSSALADSATYTLGHAETGYGLASDTGPYATVSVSLAGTVATVTFNSQNNGVYSYLFYDGGAAVLNVQGAFSVTGLAYQSANSPGLSGASGFTDPLALTCQSPSGPIPGTPTCVNGSGGEDSLNDSFSLAIYDKTNGHDTPPGGQGGSGNENYGLSQITVTLSGTWASASQVLGPTTPNGFLAGAHMEACTYGDCQPINTDQGTNQGYAYTSEPGTPTLLLSGLFGLGLVGLGRRLLS